MTIVPSIATHENKRHRKPTNRRIELAAVGPKRGSANNSHNSIGKRGRPSRDAIALFVWRVINGGQTQEKDGGRLSQHDPGD